MRDENPKSDGRKKGCGLYIYIEREKLRDAKRDCQERWMCLPQSWSYWLLTLVFTCVQIQSPYIPHMYIHTTPGTLSYNIDHLLLSQIKKPFPKSKYDISFFPHKKIVLNVVSGFSFIFIDNFLYF